MVIKAKKMNSLLVTLIISPHIVTKFEYVELFILN